MEQKNIFWDTVIVRILLITFLGTNVNMEQSKKQFFFGSPSEHGFNMEQKQVLRKDPSRSSMLNLSCHSNPGAPVNFVLTWNKNKV